MRIKEKGQRLQLLRTEYVPEIKRGRDIMIGSLSKYAGSVPDDVRELLTADELEKLETYLTQRREASTVMMQGFALDTLPSKLREAMEGLKSADKVAAMKPDHIAEIWACLDAMRTAMRKAGLSKPKAD
jgi:hypothetical protein